MFRVVASCYFQSGTVSEYPVAARSEQTLRPALGAGGRWYDFSDKVSDPREFVRRFAGRVETGAPSISDPAMGDVAHTNQWVV